MKSFLALLLLLISFRGWPEATTPILPKIWIVSEYNLHVLSWNDLGLEQESSFIVPVQLEWKKWAEKYGEVSICQDDCFSFYQSWQSRTQQELSAQDTPYKGGYFLKVTADLRRLSLPESPERVYQWEVKAVLLEISTKRIIGSGDSLQQKKNWLTEDQKTINSYLASSIYRLAVDIFPSLLKDLEKPSGSSHSSLVRIEGHRSISDVLALQNVLKDRGQRLGITSSLAGFKGQEASIRCFYRGEEKEFSDLLSELKELKSSYSYRLEIVHNGQDHLIKFLPE